MAHESRLHSGFVSAFDGRSSPVGGSEATARKGVSTQNERAVPFGAKDDPCR
jgi:hypothetical protein